MKKIVFVIGSLGIGGAERVVSILANEFSHLGYDSSVILYYQNRIDYSLDENVKMCYIDVRNKNKIGRVIDRINNLRKTILDINPDVVVSFLTEINIYTLIATIGLKMPIVISERNDPYHDPQQRALRIAREIVYKWSDGIVFQTQDAMEFFSKLDIKKTIIENPIREDLPVAFEGARSKRIVSVCRLTMQKNIKLLINAFSRLDERLKQEYIVEIYGEGPQKEEIEGWIEEKKLTDKVFLKGFSKNVYNDILDAGLFISTSDYEGISNSMLEALAIGIPTICTDCPIGGARLAIKSGYNGVLIEVGNEKQLIEAMEYILTDEEVAEEISSHWREVRERFSAKKVNEKWLSFIEEIL